jgi:hypothetical protein
MSHHLASFLVSPAHYLPVIDKLPKQNGNIHGLRRADHKWVKNFLSLYSLMLPFGNIASFYRSELLNNITYEGTFRGAKKLLSPNFVHK